MARVDVDLPQRDWDRLRAYAARQRTAVPEALRELVTRALEDAADAEEGSVPPSDPSVLRSRALAVLVVFHDREGRTDVAENHDRYLADAVRS